MLLAFWLSTQWVLAARFHGLAPLNWQRAIFRISRRLAWPCYVLYSVGLLSDGGDLGDRVWAWIGVITAGLITWWDWKRTKGMDDDDWMKRLKEAGTGLVERLGNRLVVVPAPAGAR